MTGHVDDRLSAYLDNELSVAERAAVEAHLTTCDACAGQLQELAAVDAATRALRVKAPDGYFEAFPGRVRQRLEAKRRPAWRVPGWSWAAAAALLLAVLTPLTLRESFTPPLEEAEAPARSRTVPIPPTTLALSKEEAPDEAALDAVAPAPLASVRDEAEDLERAPKKAPEVSVAAERLEQERHDAPQRQEVKRARARAATPQTRAAAPGPQEETLRTQAAPAEFAEQPPALEEEVASNLATKSKAPASAQPGLAEGRVQASGARPGQEADRAPSAPLQAGERGAVLAGADAYAALTLRRPRTADEARELREAWRAFAQAEPEGPRADAARVRVIETGAAAYRLGRDPEDLATLRADAAAYLERSDARQKPRVQRVLEEFAGDAPEG